ncbi:two-partner secretion domain-containing protein, partial [Neisseria dentiae]|uniref:two-partner secretion domain-containing protein n=1 Tax=Neisseria dentiae TaxID=194197 RepID=UPI00211C2231
MNKTLYRVIFNAHKGCLTAVPEYAARRGKSTADKPSAGGVRFGIGRLAFSIMAATGAAAVLPAQASDIRADRNAPAGQQPTVLQTANGLPQVNIQTPSAAGVSVNQYRQFDVSQRGAVLNNSRGNVQTRLGGWIQGNPWLAGGEARIIVNQVNSAAPSRLNGYIETAGRRAEVVVANPAGIQINGGGFINAAGVTLTTGKPLFDNGSLSGFQVRGGGIAVNGAGLDTSDADYTRILARAAEINAGVWAQDLSVVSGGNDIAADGKYRAVSDGGSAAAVIDTGRLGGMYAGKITLIATGTGAAVNNAGQLYAAAGGVTLSADGRIGNSGSIISAGSAAVGTGAFANSSSLSAQQDARIQTATLENSGLIASAGETVIRNGGGLENSGRINANRLDIETGRLNNSGGISQSGQQNLNVSARGVENRGLIGSTPADGGNTGGATGGQNTPAAPGGGSTNGGTPTAPAVPAAAGNLAVSDGLTNSGSISANGLTNLNVAGAFNNRQDISLGSFLQKSGDFDNSGRFYAADAAIEAGSIRNSGSLTAASGSATARTLANSGEIAAGSLSIAAALTNQNRITTQSLNISGDIRNSGTIAADDLAVNARQLDNRSGSIHGSGSVDLAVSDGLDNSAGGITAGGSLKVHDRQAQSLAVLNTGGRILAGADLGIEAKSLTNDGTTGANRDTVIKLYDSFHNSCTLESGRLLSIESSGDITNSGTLRGGGALYVNAAGIHNSGTAESGGDTRLNARGTLANSGLINSNGLTAAVAGHIDNIGRLYGDWVALGGERLSNRESADGKAGVVAARQHLAVGVADIRNQEGAILSSEGTLAIGGRLNEARQAEGMAQRLVNSSAKIEAKGSGRIAAAYLVNEDPHLKVEEYLAEQKDVVSYTRVGEAEPFFVEGRDGTVKWEKHDVNLFPHQGGNIHYHKYAVEQLRRNTYTQNTYRQRIIESRPAEILIGGDLHISGENWQNKDGNILVGGTLSGNGNGLPKNEPTQAVVRVENDGHSRRGSYDKHGWGKRHI